jgi:hypothetical protein
MQLPTIARVISFVLVGFVAVIMFALLRLRTAQTRDNIQKILDGEFWIHWTYSAEDMQQFAQIVKTRKDGLSYLVVGGLIFIFFAVLGAIAAKDDIGVTILSVGIGSLVAIMPLTYLRIPKNYPTSGANEIYVAAEGIYQPGPPNLLIELSRDGLIWANDYLSRGTRRRIRSIKFRTGQPAIIELELNGRSTKIPETYWISVPSGEETNAQHIVERFKNEVMTQPMAIN